VNRLIRISTATARLMNQGRDAETKARDLLVPAGLRKELKRAGELAAQGGLTAGGLGELSARINVERFAISARDSDPASAMAEFVVIDLESGSLAAGGEPARHADWHRLVYLTTLAKWVFMSQPRAALVLAAELRLPEERWLTGASESLGGLAAVPAETKAVEKALLSHRILLVQGAGVFACGENPDELISRVRLVERWCEASLPYSDRRQNA